MLMDDCRERPVTLSSTAASVIEKPLEDETDDCLSLTRRFTYVALLYLYSRVGFNLI